VTEKRDAASLRAKLVGQTAEPAVEKIPRSIIVHFGNVGLRVKRLEQDMRQLMLPYTAKDLQVAFLISNTNFISFLGQKGECA
jgi:hypothetical protein